MLVAAFVLRAAEVACLEVATLDIRPRRPVEHDDALGEERAEAIGPSRGAHPANDSQNRRPLETVPVECPRSPGAGAAQGFHDGHARQDHPFGALIAVMGGVTPRDVNSAVARPAPVDGLTIRASRCSWS